MGLDVVALLVKLGVSLDTGSPPITSPGVISWCGRISEVSPELLQLGLVAGMEIWSSGQGFAPLDREAIEEWLFDAPRGNHLIIAERELTFDPANPPIRENRELLVWSKESFAAFIGHAVLDGRLTLFEESVVETEVETESSIFQGPGPFALKPSNDFSILEEEGLDVSLAKPVMIESRIYLVKGSLVGPEKEEIESWVLDCGGLHHLTEFELLNRAPMLNRETVPLAEELDFTDVLSQRRPHSDGMGDLLRWWKFEQEGEITEQYDVLVPAHKGLDAYGKVWLIDGVTNTLHRNF